jgi:hypothetical protein
MGQNEEGAVRIEPPLKDVASKMPLPLFRCCQPEKVAQNSGKNAQTFEKSPDNIKQCFRSSRGFGIFFEEALWLNWKIISELPLSYTKFHID